MNKLITNTNISAILNEAEIKDILRVLTKEEQAILLNNHSTFRNRKHLISAINESIKKAEKYAS